MENVGVVPTSETPSKKDLLFFDRFVLAGARPEHPATSGRGKTHGYGRRKDDAPSSSPLERQLRFELGGTRGAERAVTLELLKERGLLDVESGSFESLLQRTEAELLASSDYRIQWKRFADAETYEERLVSREMDLWELVRAPQPRRNLVDFLSQTRARLIALNATTDACTYTPILNSSTLAQSATQRTDAVLRVVLNAFPVPSDDVSIEEVLSFRAEPKVHRQLELLRRWVRKGVADEKKSPAMIGEELADGLSDFTEHMRLARMKYRTEVIQILLTCPLATVERIAKLQFSQLLEPIFSLTKAHIGLLEAELKAPGRELAYIQTVAARLGRGA